MERKTENFHNTINIPKINHSDNTVICTKDEDNETVFKIKFPTSKISQDIVTFLDQIYEQELSIENDEVRLLISKVDQVLENHRLDRIHNTMIRELNGYDPGVPNEDEINGLQNLRNIFQEFISLKNEYQISVEPQMISNNEENNKNIIQRLMAWMYPF